MTIGDEKSGNKANTMQQSSGSNSKSGEMDSFELFCEQARSPTGRRRKLSSCEYGGSLPCLPKDKAASPRPHPLLTRAHTPLGPTRSTDGHLSVPNSPHNIIRRTRSHCGDGGRLLSPSGSGAASPVSPLALSPVASPRTSKKSKPLKLWSSFKSLVDSCEGQPDCMSPETPYLPVAVHVAVHKCTSAPNSRSPSFRRKKNTRHTSDSSEDNIHHNRNRSFNGKGISRRPNLLQLDNSLTPACSLEDGDIQRVRNLVTTPKGIINCGDSLRAKSPCSVASFGSCDSREEISSIGSATSLLSGDVGDQGYKILILGATGSGKTTLSQQFTTSESVVEKECNSESVFEDCISVTVQLDEEDATVNMIELRSEEDIRLLPDFDAYVVVYSIDNRHSFHHAMDVLYNIRQEDDRGRLSVILVANKTDLVRNRVIAHQEGQSAAETYSCKYIEVSALMGLKVDELLAGIINQIRLHQNPGYRKRIPSSGRKSPMRFINKILKRQGSVSKSCENLSDL